jgi:hypothetical protein
MKIATKLAIVLMPRDLAAEFFARVRIGTPVKVFGDSRNVTRVRRAIPVVQYAESRSTANSSLLARSQSLPASR